MQGHIALAVNTLTTVATVRLRPPERRVARAAIALWTLENLVGAVLTLLVATVIAWWLSAAAPSWVPRTVSHHAWWLPAILALLAVPGVLVAPTWRYAVHRWEVSADVLYTRTGWFNREWQLVPVSRIQTVDTTQSWLERPLGLATLRVQTASHAGSSEVEGLPAPVATALAEQLAVRAGTFRDDAT